MAQKKFATITTLTEFKKKLDEANGAKFAAKGDIKTYTAGDGIEITENAVKVKVKAEESGGLSVSEEGLSLAAATGSSAGAMTAAQYTKLDALPAAEEIAKKTELEEYAKTADLDGTYAKTADLEGYAKTVDLVEITAEEIDALFVG